MRDVQNRRFLLLSSAALLLSLGCASAQFPQSSVPDTSTVIDTQSPSNDTQMPSVDLAIDVVDQSSTPLSGTPDVEPVVAPIQQAEASVSCPPAGQSSDPQFVSVGAVTLTDVVVTGVAHYAGTGWERFYVADLAGGEWSGIAVDMPQGTLSVQLGERVSVNGELQEYYCLTRVKITSATQLTRDGTAPLPAALTITCDQLTHKSQAEALEGVLVRVENVTVASHGDFGQLTLNTGCLVDDDFKPYPAGRPAIGTAFSAVLGIVTYGFGSYSLLPRSSADLIAP